MSGLQGIQGMRGLQGNPGPTGAQGPAGIQGMIGVQGIPGPTGAQGNAGIRGVQGVPGLPGGPTGWTGYTGPTGANGYVGSDGSTGREGVQGPQGVQGMQGVQGNDGPQGVQGIQGVQGNDGPQGVQGIQGVLGNTGPQGVQGLQGIQGDTGPTGSPVSGSLVTLSTYTGTVITNAVAANNSSITTVWSNALPTAAKGRAGTLGMFFNMYSATQFASNTSFDYGVYIDGSSISYGESNTSRYVQTTTSTYAFSSNGYVLGVGGMTPYQPISFPLYIPPQATTLSVGIANASIPFSPVQSVALAYLSNIMTSSGTSNTSNFIPQNTFTTTGQFSYTVPSLCSAGAVTGVFIYLWGSGGNYQHNGGWGNQNGAGGSGGFVSGYYGCSPGTVLSYIVGLGGGSIGLDNLNRVGTLDTGGGSGDAGGFSGVFLSNAVVSNTIGIAGGGGGAAYSTGYGGAGGYPTASSGYKSVGGSGAGVPSTGMGGSQTAGGTGTGNSFISPSSQFFGANGNQCCGGGGWFGGGQGAAGGGGGGGSSYIGNVNGASGGIGMIGATTSNGITFSNASMFPISNALPGGTTSPFYQSGRGHGSGGHGLVVIIPAVGTNPVYMGVNARLLAT